MQIIDGKVLVGYGLGTYYNVVKDNLPFKLDYLCDRRYRDFGTKYNGIPVIAPMQLKEIDHVYVIVFALNSYIYKSISDDLTKLGIEHGSAQNYINMSSVITGKELREVYNNDYRDDWGNRIICENDLIGDNLHIILNGGKNQLKIGSDVKLGCLEVRFGNNGNCSIGKGTEIIEMQIHVTNGSVTLEQDCLVAAGVWITNHDHHSIFDGKTGKRINTAKNVKIGNHVWIGQGATLLPGFEIGDNSVIGAKSVSSSQYGNNLIIAGNPAKIIREDIIWSCDNTEFYQRDAYCECIDKRGRQYKKDDC